MKKKICYTCSINELNYSIGIVIWYGLRGSQLSFFAVKYFHDYLKKEGYFFITFLLVFEVIFVVGSLYFALKAFERCFFFLRFFILVFFERIRGEPICIEKNRTFFDLFSIYFFCLFVVCMFIGQQKKTRELIFCNPKRRPLHVVCTLQFFLHFHMKM